MSDTMDEFAVFTKTWIAFHDERPDIDLAWFIAHYRAGDLLRDIVSRSRR